VNCATPAGKWADRQRIAANLGEPSFIHHGLHSPHDPQGPHELLTKLFAAVENAQTPGQHAMAFGVVGAALGWPDTEMACAFLYSTCAGLTAAALRLLPLGQLAGQRMLWSLAPAIASLAKEVEGQEFADIWSSGPGIEIASMRHARLDARLFRS
jgi:urease accessory protein